ncbi:pyridoxal-phosphate dependent enzyme [Aliagarivorans taiwanensis]|uniref:pyridoxal-phosphate dependent enzyme n=1 Tax=Aliagarivorans taiwanensis TaxID=561966 RepID=UPI00040CE2B6|nr:pyridoxal-phosphate dependent enzyme [Aliagarivorans taiwanensis]
MLSLPSPVSSFEWQHRRFYIKRDELIHPHFSGNKARKFMQLLAEPASRYQGLVGFGSALANSLYSLAALCHLKGWRLDYYVDHIASYLKQQPSGNYAAALELGANIIECGAARRANGLTMQDYLQQTLSLVEGQLLIPEGGRCSLAKPGVVQLAEEIDNWRNDEGFEQLIVMLPSGTGTTAVYLAQHFALHCPGIQVWTCACVGGSDYLKQQFTELVSNPQQHPRMLPLAKPHHFGKLYPEQYRLWQLLLAETGIEFDLLYDPLGWQCLLAALEQQPVSTPILYLHQGGLAGNPSMQARYQRKLARIKH